MYEETKKECEHKWIPNGIVKREIWNSEGWHFKIGEVVMASCICEKCGEIKIKGE